MKEGIITIDLSNLATRRDLEKLTDKFATKEDVEKFSHTFATKEDLGKLSETFATKKDLQKLDDSFQLFAKLVMEEFKKLPTKEDFDRLERNVRPRVEILEDDVLMIKETIGLPTKRSA